MKRHRMNLSAAAREAQIDRKHLRELLRKYGLDNRLDPADRSGE
jgi:DNA-binding NtrC family response regulator